MTPGKFDPKTIFNFPSTTTITQDIESLKARLAEGHDATDHQYAPYADAQVCSVCGWIHPDQQAECGEHTLRQHVEVAIEYLQSLIHEATRTIVVEIQVIRIPKKTSWWPF